MVCARLAPLLSLVLACASQPARRGATEPPEIVHVARRADHGVLLLAGRVVVIDPGPSGSAERLLRALRRRGHPPQDVALIVVTGGAAELAGAAAELRARTGAPILTAVRDTSVARDYPGFVPDLRIVDDLDLHPLGLPARLLARPGHILALVLDDGRTLGDDRSRASK